MNEMISSLSFIDRSNCVCTLTHSGFSLSNCHAKITLIWYKGDYECRMRQKEWGEKQFSFWLLQDTKHEQRPYFPSKLGKAGSRAQTITHGSQVSEGDLLEMNRLLSKEAGEGGVTGLQDPPPSPGPMPTLSKVNEQYCQ